MPKKKREPVPTSTVKDRITLKRAITRYTNAAVDNSWCGNRPVEEHDEIERRWREAPEKLTYAIDVFEAATRADAIKMILDASEPEPKPLPENAECRYCYGNMHFYSEIAAGPCKCAPAATQVWRHTNGKLYVVIGLSNTYNLRGDHPIDVVYRTHALDADNESPKAIWTRRLSDWSRSFVRACDVFPVIPARGSDE